MFTRITTWLTDVADWCYEKVRMAASYAPLDFSQTVLGTVVDVGPTTTSPVIADLVICVNNTASVAYLQCFKLSSNLVVLGTTVADFVWPIIASSGFVAPFPTGKLLSGGGFSIAATTSRTNAVASSVDVYISGRS